MNKKILADTAKSTFLLAYDPYFHTEENMHQLKNSIDDIWDTVVCAVIEQYENMKASECTDLEV